MVRRVLLTVPIGCRERWKCERMGDQVYSQLEWPGLALTLDTRWARLFVEGLHCREFRYADNRWTSLAEVRLAGGRSGQWRKGLGGRFGDQRGKPRQSYQC
jgi:hypothetical protein